MREIGIGTRLLSRTPISCPRRKTKTDRDKIELKKNFEIFFLTLILNINTYLIEVTSERLIACISTFYLIFLIKNFVSVTFSTARV